MNHEEVKKQIEAEIVKTERYISDYKELTKPVSSDRTIDQGPRMNAINNKSISAAALRQAEEKLHKLKYALTKVGTPEFGICMQCGEKIPLGRILIRPESSYCVRCAQ